MIDLHSHTDCSDGTCSPLELLTLAKEVGLHTLAITDHDTFAGYDAAAPVAAGFGIRLLAGIEISTRMETPGPGRKPSAHLLGYFPNGGPPVAFREWVFGHELSRRKRNLDLIDRLNSLGVEITLAEVQVLGKNLTARPHFAQVLLRKGYVKTLQEAFDRYLADGAQASVERDEPTLVEGTRRIAEANGIPSLAHPVRLPGGQDRDELSRLLGPLKDAGLRAIEVYHSEHSTADEQVYASLASTWGLGITGGSDFHGANKPTIALGSGRNGTLRIPEGSLEWIWSNEPGQARHAAAR
jgi:hypothetical protein